MKQSTTWALRGVGFAGLGLAMVVGTLRAHDTRLLAVQLAGYAVVGAAMAAWVILERRGADQASLAAALGVMCTAASAVAATRTGAPVVVLAAIAALGAGSSTRFGYALAVTGAGIFGFLVSAIVVHQTNGASLAGLPATIVTGLILGLNRRTYQVQAEQAEELLQRSKQVQELQRRADVLDERARIAREIHDVLAHSLGGLGIQVQAARAVLSDHSDVEQALELLATAQRLASDGLTETRRALHALRADTLPLDEELRELAESRADEVTYTITGTPRTLPAGASVALLRVAQEAMVNAAKHAVGQPLDLSLAYEPEQIRLTVANPLGARATQALRTADTGYGLAGMKERLMLLGGTLWAGPHAGTWTVRAELPHHEGPDR